MTTRLTTEPGFRRIAEIVLAASKAEHTLVELDHTLATTLRFANNQAVQHVSQQSPGLSVTVSFGKREGTASTNRLDEASLREVVRAAESIAKVAPEDPEHLSPLGPQSYAPLPSTRPATAAATPMDLAQRAKALIDGCVARRLTAAGTVSTTLAARGVAASTGLFGFEEATDAAFSLTATAEDGSTGAAGNSHRDIQALGEGPRAARAIDKAARSSDPRELPAGRYPVILEPSAVASLLGPFFWSASARSYHKGSSPFVGKLGAPILDPRLTLRTDPAHPALLGARWGREGLAARPVTWIERGVLKSLAYDRFTAQAHGAEPTPSADAPILELSGPTAGSLDELIASTKRAILVSSFWYIRYVNPVDLTLTGMTRDGTFLVEDGKIVGPVKSFRFHDSPLRCFARVDAATSPLEAVSAETGKMLLPALRLPELYFSSVTKF